MRRSLLLAILLAARAATADAQRADVVVKGSDTIGGELGPDLARAFTDAHPGKKVAWEALGSKTAFVGLLDGSADLGAASRQVNKEEYAQAASLGADLQEFVIGFDGIAIIVNPENDIGSLTVAQLGELFSGKVTNWRDLGGPEVPVKLIARPSYSGTRSFFDEKVFPKHKTGGPGMAAAALVLESNKQIVPLVAREKGAVSFVGLGSLSKKVRAVPLAGQGEAVEASIEHVRDGTYPLYRALYLYSRGQPAGDAAALLQLALSAQGQALVEKHGFVARGAGAEVKTAAAADPAAQAPAADNKPVRILFPAGSSQLDDSRRGELAELAAMLVKEGKRALIVGHADNSGSTARNHRLSLRRARSVAAMLERLSVPADRLKIDAQGADSPVASNDGQEGRDQNRRVDVYIIGR